VTKVIQEWFYVKAVVRIACRNIQERLKLISRIALGILKGEKSKPAEKYYF
jgi:hypothetical protein